MMTSVEYCFGQDSKSQYIEFNKECSPKKSTIPLKKVSEDKKEPLHLLLRNDHQYWVYEIDYHLINSKVKNLICYK